MNIVKTEYVEFSREEIATLKRTMEIADGVVARATDPALKEMYQAVLDALLHLEYCYDPTKEPKEEETK